MDVLDDQPITEQSKDISGGMNERLDGSILPPNQVTVLYNGDISVPGKRSKRKGMTLIANDIGAKILGASAFYPPGKTDRIVCICGTTFYEWLQTGNWVSKDTGFTTGKDTNFFEALGILYILNGTDNVHTYNGTGVTDLGDTNTDPPHSTLGVYLLTRAFYAGNSTNPNYVWFSNALDPTICDRTTNAFKFKSDVKALIPFREYELIIFGRDTIEELYCSGTTPLTDWVIKPINLSVGTVAPRSVISVGDDIYFLAQDGVRSLRRTEDDAIRGSGSLPLTWYLKDTIEDINWAYADKSCAVFWNNMVAFAVPVGDSAVPNRWLVKYFTPGLSLYEGWSVHKTLPAYCFVKFIISGEERLYYGAANDGIMLRAYHGTSDNGTAISYQEESRIHCGKFPDGDYSFNEKTGVIFEYKAETSAGLLKIYYSIDEAGYVFLASLDLSGGSIYLPQRLPFTLPRENIARLKKHLESIGQFKNIKFKFIHDGLDEEFTGLEYALRYFLENLILED